ncbi:MAG: ABC transporter permease [Odoribacteraceae bacterium]|jgi:ABC-2 type transport system permease protein|nr:ABC transporter permease [Odoribacteraceae bacterium]
MMRVMIKKELSASFHSPFTYAVFALLAGITGLVYWFSNVNVFYRGEVSLEVLFQAFECSLLLLVPPLTMKSIAREREAGTLDLLFSKPVKTWDIIGGKYCAILLQVVFFLFITSIYYFTVSFLGDADHAIGCCGYLGLVLVAGCYVSIGLFASSLTRSPVVALLLALLFLCGFQFLSHAIADASGDSPLVAFFRFLSVDEHFKNISRGIIDTRDLVYFCSVIALFLVLTRHYTLRAKS